MNSNHIASTRIPDCIQSNRSRIYELENDQEVCKFNASSDGLSTMLPEINCPNDFRILGCTRLDEILNYVNILVIYIHNSFKFSKCAFLRW